MRAPIGPLSADGDSDSDFVDTKRGRKATKAKPRATKAKVVGKKGPKEGKLVVVESLEDETNGEEVAVETEGDAMAQKGNRKMVMVDVEVVLKRGKRGRPRRQVDLSENVTRVKGEEENDGGRPYVQEEETDRRPLVDVAAKTSRRVGKKENKLAVDENDDGEFDSVGEILSEDEDDESDFDKGKAKRKGKKQAAKKELPVSSKLALATVKQQVTSNTATTAATPRLKAKAKSDNLIGISNDGGTTKIDIVARTASLEAGRVSVILN